MANKLNISNDENKTALNVTLRKSFQSAHINFLIGSGCSSPAIKPLGNIEKEIDTLFKDGKELEAEILMCEFLKPIAESNNLLLSDKIDEATATTLSNYRAFVTNLFTILTKRKNNILPKQATVFNTNYDLFIKKASEEFGSALKINDGFNRNPKLNNQFTFSATEFFNTVFNKGTLYNYHVEIPSLNLIKLHGSLGWGTSGRDIVFQTSDYLKVLTSNRLSTIIANANDNQKLKLALLKQFNSQFNIILPTKNKFRDTILNHVYYNLLRIYANELDKENTLLIAEGFSFEDEHILDVTQRALKNPTLRLLIFSFRSTEVESYQNKFGQYNNVDIIYKQDSDILDFAEFNGIIEQVLSQKSLQITNKSASQEENNDDK